MGSHASAYRMKKKSQAFAERLGWWDKVLPRVKCQNAFLSVDAKEGMEHAPILDLSETGIDALALHLKSGFGEIYRKGPCKRESSCSSDNAAVAKGVWPCGASSPMAVIVELCVE